MITEKNIKIEWLAATMTDDSGKKVDTGRRICRASLVLIAEYHVDGKYSTLELVTKDVESDLKLSIFRRLYGKVEELLLQLLHEVQKQLPYPCSPRTQDNIRNKFQQIMVLLRP